MLTLPNILLFLRNLQSPESLSLFSAPFFLQHLESYSLLSVISMALVREHLLVISFLQSCSLKGVGESSVATFVMPKSSVFPAPVFWHSSSAHFSHCTSSSVAGGSITVHGATSPSFPITSGVPQGSVLSDTPFFLSMIFLPSVDN